MHRLRAPVGVSEIFDLDGGSGRIHGRSILLMVFMGAPFVVEHIQSFLDQFEEFIAGHLQMVRLHDGLVDVLDQQLAPDFLAQCRLIFFQETTPPRQRLNDAQVGGVYPPGSTFKPVVALAALEAGTITPQTTITCPGYLELGDATFHCWRKGGHGTLHLRDAIKESCDVFFYETARRTGIDRIAAMAHRFGFGAPLGLDIPGERGGLMPTREWKLATTGTTWQQGETVISGIGQGSVLATPLQLATMAARLTTGRAILPHLVREERLPPGGDQHLPDFKGLGLDPHHLALVLDGMNAVVNEQGGTAYAARITDPALAMGGKSGTSQVRRITQYERDHGLRKVTEIPWKERDHALFVAFAPVGAPRYVCAIVIEHGGTTGGGGSAVAAPICRDVLSEVQRRDPARRIPPPDVVSESAPPEPPAPTLAAVAPHRL